MDDCWRLLPLPLFPIDLSHALSPVFVLDHVHFEGLSSCADCNRSVIGPYFAHLRSFLHSALALLWPFLDSARFLLCPAGLAADGGRKSRVLAFDLLLCFDLVLECVDVSLLLLFPGLVGVGAFGSVGRTPHVFLLAVEAGKVDRHVVLPLLRLGAARLLELLHDLPLLVVRFYRSSFIGSVLLLRKRIRVLTLLGLRFPLAASVFLVALFFCGESGEVGTAGLPALFGRVELIDISAHSNDYK